MATGFSGLGTLLNPGVSSVTQDDLIALAQNGLAPGPQSILNDRSPSPMRFPGLQLPTLRQLNSLDDEEMKNLNTLLMNKYNVQAPSVYAQSQRQFQGGGFAAPSQVRGIGL